MKIIELGDAEAVLVRLEEDLHLISRAQIEALAGRAKATKGLTPTKTKAAPKAKAGKPAKKKTSSHLIGVPNIGARLAQMIRHTPGELKKGVTPKEREDALLEVVGKCSPEMLERQRKSLTALAKKHHMARLAKAIK